MLLRTFFLVFLADFASASQFMTAGLASNSKHQWLVWLGSAIALMVSSLMCVYIGKFLSRVPFPTKYIEAGILICVGLLTLFRK